MATTVGMCSRIIRNLYHLNTLQGGRVVYTRQCRYLSSTAPDVNTSSAKSEESAAEDKVDDEKLAAVEEKMNEEILKLKSSIGDIEDKYKRSIAETENVRQRMTKQIEDTKLFGIQGFCKDLLEVADILGKATESVPKDLVSESNPHLKGLFEGLAMTESQLHKVFNRHGLFQINPKEGEKFDPDVHEALFQQPVPGKEGNTVATVTKTGYKLHSRTIRPALVGVYK